MLYLITWKYAGNNCRGFICAENENNAEQIAINKLSNSCSLTGIYPAYETQITPKALTINFPNTTQYELF